MKGLIKFLWIVVSVFILYNCTHKATPVQSKPAASARSSTGFLKSNKEEDFKKFYERFHKDSLFQISRVKFPLQGKQVNAEGTNSWKKERWTMIKATAGEINTSEYNVKTTKSKDTYFEGIYCKNCGFSFEMKFQLIDRKWYLVYLLDNDL